MPQCFYTDFGAYANRVVSIPMYATNSPQQIEYVVNDASIQVLFVGEQLQYNNAFKVQKNSTVLKRLIVFDRGGHLGALYLPVVQGYILELLREWR